MLKCERKKTVGYAENLSSCQEYGIWEWAGQVMPFKSDTEIREMVRKSSVREHMLRPKASV